MQTVISASCLVSVSSLFFLHTFALWSSMLTTPSVPSSVFLSCANRAPALAQLFVLPEISSHLIGESCAHVHKHTHTHTTHTHTYTFHAGFVTLNSCEPS